MKKLFLIFSLFFFLFSFAISDTDSDGVGDERDLCPRVYSRSETGCPRLTPAVALPALNTCYSQQNSTFIVRVRPLCDAATRVCATLSSVSGVQTCDPLFPLILRDGQPFVRWSIFVVGF